MTFLKLNNRYESKSSPSVISFYGVGMADNYSFDNLNVWERKQDVFCKLNFEVWSYFYLFAPWRTSKAVNEPRTDE